MNSVAVSFPCQKFMFSTFLRKSEIHVFHISTEIRKFMNFRSGFISLPEIHVFHISTEIWKVMNSRRVQMLALDIVSANRRLYVVC